MNYRRQSPSSFNSSHHDRSQSIEQTKDLRVLLDDIYRSISKAYTPLREYRTKKQNRQDLAQAEILDIYRNVKDGCAKLKSFKDLYDKSLDNQIDREMMEEMANLKRRNTELLEMNRSNESEYHKKIIDLQEDYGKRQQQYESVLNSFVKSTIDARRSILEFQEKVAQLLAMVQERNGIEEDAKEFYSTIISMMHSVSTKNSVNDSQMVQPCEMSSIMKHQCEDDLLGENANYEEYEDEDVDAELRKIEQAIKVLEARGLFNKQNEQFLLRFLDLKQRFSWNELTQSNYYTELLQFLKEGGNQEESMEQTSRRTIIENNNEDSESLLDYHSQNREMVNCQGKVDMSIMDQQSSITINETYLNGNSFE